MLEITRTKALIAQYKKLIWMKIVSWTVMLVKLWKALMQSKIFQLGQTKPFKTFSQTWEHFTSKFTGTLLRQSERHTPKNSPHLHSSLLSHESEHTVQNRRVNDNYDFDKNSDFIINLLNDRISLLERQQIEKNSIIDFFLEHKLSPVANYSNINCGNRILMELTR